MAALDPILLSALEISFLLFVSMVMGEIFGRFKLPPVVGQVLAGVIFSPAALGGIEIFGRPLVTIDVLVQAFAYIGVILILFSAGLGVTFAEFRAAGPKSFFIAGCEVTIPFLIFYYSSLSLGIPWQVSLIVALSLGQTSVAITLKALEEIGARNSKDARLLLNTAIADDALGLATLSVILSLAGGGQIPSLARISLDVLIAIVAWFGLVAGASIVLPRLIHLRRAWPQGKLETFSTILCFGSAALAAKIGLSPIVGAFAAGVGIGGAGVLKRVGDYIERVQLVFIPIFFASVGAQMDVLGLLSGTGSTRAFLTFIFLAYAATLLTTVLPSRLVVKSWLPAIRIGFGMTIRGEEGLVVLGVALGAGLIPKDVFASVAGVALVTTVLGPIFLKRLFAVSPPEGDAKVQGKESAH